MTWLSRVAGVASIVGLAAVGGAPVASAYSFAGGAYTGTATSPQTYTVGGGAYTISCSNVSFSGSAGGSATTTLTPSYSGCSFFGFPAIVTITGSWNLTATGNAGSAYTGDLEIPAGASMTTTIPIMGCTTTVSGPQTFRHGVGGNTISMTNYSGGVSLTMGVNNVVYTATGCPYSSGTDGVYDSNGDVTFAGLTVS